MLPNNRHPYYIITPPYVRTSAGVRCLHILCHTLNARGETAYIVLDPFHIRIGSIQKSGEDLLTPHLTQEIADEHQAAGKMPIVIYHELIDGNPYNASCIVRLFFNFPKWTGDDITHSSQELCYGYSPAIAAAAGVPENVFYIPSVDTRRFSPPAKGSIRQGSCYYADKYRKVHKAFPYDVTKDSVEITRDEEGAQTASEIAELFRRSEVFYTYENSALAIEAVLCGCPAVFIPNPYLQSIIGVERLGMDGFSWGVDPANVARAKATVHKGAENYQRLVERFSGDLEAFVSKTKHHANTARRRGESFMIPVKEKDIETEASVWASVRERNAELFFKYPFMLGAASLLPINLHRRLSEFCGTVKLRTAGAVLWQNCDFREMAAARNQAVATSKPSMTAQKLDSAPTTSLSSPGAEQAEASDFFIPGYSRESLLELFHTAATRCEVDMAYSPGQPISLTKGKRRFLLAESHLVYTKDLIENFEYYFRSTDPLREDGYEIVDYSKPDWHTLHSGERMFYTGLAEDLGAVEQYINVLKPKTGEIVLDVGAYCGLSTISFSKAVGATGKVVAFEPDPNNFGALLKNLKQAQVLNVIPSNSAMSGADGALHFSSEGNMGSHLSSVSTERGKSIEVQTVTLRTALAKYNLDRVDVIKLDIEGAEYSVIESSVDLIENLGARWAIELHADQPAGLPLCVDRIRDVFDRARYLTTVEASEGTVPSMLFAFPKSVSR